MTSRGFAKAVLINVETDERIACLFNPSEYTVSKTNVWKPGKRSGANTPSLEFGNGAPASLSMELLFDSYGEGDVRKAYTDAVLALMLVDRKLKDRKNKKGRPPRVRFQWGGTWSFVAVLTSVSQRFTLFESDGTPVRATLSVEFQQVEDEARKPRQNPTSGGDGGERVWTVVEGDTLEMIAHDAYGDATMWRPIASANRLDRVRDLDVGAELIVPVV